MDEFEFLNAMLGEEEEEEEIKVGSYKRVIGNPIEVKNLDGRLNVIINIVGGPQKWNTRLCNAIDQICDKPKDSYHKHMPKYGDIICTVIDSDTYVVTASCIDDYGVLVKFDKCAKAIIDYFENIHGYTNETILITSEEHKSVSEEDWHNAFVDHGYDVKIHSMFFVDWKKKYTS
jgi:hypothetical protein